MSVPPEDERRREHSDSLLPPGVRAFASLAAESSYPVLLHGETGAGKTHLARLIHQLGPRSTKPFVPVNCAAVPENLFESEMFGHVRGAFTGATESRPGLFEMANGGTLFLDEIGELPLHVQPKLLRVLEKGSVRRVGSTHYTPVDVRIIAATNRDLWAMVQQGRFREDLYYRCNVLDWRIAPLRERRHDLPGLILGMLARNSDRCPEISVEALEILCSYPWPGNIRELDNALSHAVVYAEGGSIEPRHLPERVRASRTGSNGRAMGCEGGFVQRYAAPEDPRQEREMILETLRAEGGNKTRAAKRLGMSRQTLWIKITQYGLVLDEWKGGSDKEKRSERSGESAECTSPGDG